MTNNTTDTPRTDAARFEVLRSSALRQDCIPLKLGQQLERELAASKAETAELNSLMIGWKQRATMSEMDLEASKSEVAFWRAKAYEAEESESKLEAEAERLKEQLQSSVRLLTQFNTLRFLEDRSLTEKQWLEYCKLYRDTAFTQD